MNTGIAQDKHNNIKKHIDYGLHNYRVSGNSECGLKISKKGNISIIDDREDLDDSDNSFNSYIKAPEDKDKKKGVSIKDSLTVYSAEFFSYVQHNPILFYFYKAFITYDILESGALDILDEHSDNSIGCYMTSYAI